VGIENGVFLSGCKGQVFGSWILVVIVVNIEPVPLLNGECRENTIAAFVGVEIEEYVAGCKR